MKTRSYMIIGVLLILWQSVIAQDTQRIVFYNLENLFDIYDDPSIRDEEFTPEAKEPWTLERYEKKLKNISDVLVASGEGMLPAIIGMCEVENRKTTEDLLSRGNLRQGNYHLIHYDSPDERGIDVALAYREGIFQPVEHRPVPVLFKDFPDDKTRDILYVAGIFENHPQDTLHLFVNHWPSRWGGQIESEPKRVAAAYTLKAVVDSLQSRLHDPRIIIMGDLNDEPYNKSVREVLGAVSPEDAEENRSLINLMYPGFEREEGSYYYRDWDMIDQIIVSRSLMEANDGITLVSNEGGVFRPDWVMFETEDGVLRPNRTKGREYYGGYSDHLPIFIDIKIIGEN